MIELSVRCGEAGWRLEAPHLPRPRAFDTGAQAERAARDMAEALARDGHAVKLSIWLRDGSIGGRFLFPPDPEAAPAPDVSRAA